MFLLLFAIEGYSLETQDNYFWTAQQSLSQSGFILAIVICYSTLR